MVSELRHLHCKLPTKFLSHVETLDGMNDPDIATDAGHLDMRGEAVFLDLEERMKVGSARPLRRRAVHGRYGLLRGERMVRRRLRVS